MASRTSLLLFLSFAVCYTSALQVTPDSPCASVCLNDSPGLDKSDPNSFKTTPEDIVCSDDLYSTDKAGKTFEKCLTCLQKSTFSQGSSNNDLNWFLYNLRYSFESCIFGYPNSTEIDRGSSPCSTSEACGKLDKALRNGITDPYQAEQYGYCDADGGVMESTVYDSCLSCLQADVSQLYLSNFLIALEAGCLQRLPSGSRLGLNDTVFTQYPIEIVNPATMDGDGSNDAVKLPVTVIVAIAIGGFVAVLLAAGCIYMQYRRRKNRAARSQRIMQQRSSPLSFRCQTHLTPRTPNFGLDSEASSIEEKLHNPGQGAALGSNPVTAVSESKVSVNNKMLTTITTTNLPTQPRAIRTPPNRNSPDDYFTPSSAVSTRSNAPLLYSQKPYMPSYNGPSPKQPSEHSFTPGVAFSTPRDMSVPINPNAFRSDWSDASSVKAEYRTASRKEFKKVSAGAPVELQNIQTSFPPPPKR